MKELHPTFGAEIEGVDFKNVDDETLAEVRAAVDKVRACPPPRAPSLESPLMDANSMASASSATQA